MRIRAREQEPDDDRGRRLELQGMAVVAEAQRLGVDIRNQRGDGRVRRLVRRVEGDEAQP